MMTTKFDVGDIVEIKSESINVRYEVITIMTITSAIEGIRYEIKNCYGQKYIIEEDKLAKALMTKVEARNRALEYANNYLAKYDNNDYYISIRVEEGYGRYPNPYYRVSVVNLNGEIKESETFCFSNEG